MCDWNIERSAVLTSTVEPLSEECRTCRKRLRIESNDDAGKLASLVAMGNEAHGIITISGCPQRPYKALVDRDGTDRDR